MRGTRRKAIAARCMGFPAYVRAGLAPTYVEEPRTIRHKKFQAPGIDSEGKIKTVDIIITTSTFRLAPDCRRFYTQRLKRQLQRSHAL